MERENKRHDPTGSKTNRNKTREGTRTFVTNHGYVLIFCLWAIVIFGFIAVSFTQNTSTAIKTEIAYTDRIKNIYAARGACIYATQMLLLDENQENEKENETFKKTKMIQQSDENAEKTALNSWTPSSKPYTLQIGDRNCNVLISDESGKVNVNKITDSTRANFVTFLTSYTFKLDIVTAETITDSILDWLDADDLHHINGAEKDYYVSLQDPCEPKNGPFETIEELALVKGFTPQIFEKLRDYLTIYGSGKININSAGKEVLLYIPTVTSEIADEIISFRSKEGIINSIDSVKEIFRHFGIVGSDFQKVTNYLTTSDSNYMTITSVSSSDKVKSSYRIVVRKDLGSCSIIAAYPE